MFLILIFAPEYKKIYFRLKKEVKKPNGIFDYLMTIINNRNRFIVKF